MSAQRGQATFCSLALLALAACSEAPTAAQRQGLLSPVKLTSGLNLTPLQQVGLQPQKFAAIGNTTLFFGTDSQHGCEPWRTEGSPLNTRLIKDVSPGYPGSCPAGATGFTVIGPTAYFVATDPLAGAELWKTDGTTSGTVRVKDLNVGTGDGVVGRPVAYQGTLYFAGRTVSSGVELWKSDGTDLGTVMVKEIGAGTASGDPKLLTPSGGKLYFVAGDGPSGRELWRTDGTMGGTMEVKDLAPGATQGSDPTGLVDFNGLLYFAANDGASGVELWKSDGTVSTTVKVAEIGPGALGAAPANLTPVFGTLYFSTSQPSELWKTDGTTTVPVKDTTTGSRGDTLHDFVALGNKLLFVAEDDAAGAELWVSDSTGTSVLKDIRSGVAPSAPAELTVLGTRVLFSADDGTGREPWITDGTAAGTLLLRDIAATGSSTPNGFTVLGTRAWFAAEGTMTGTGLWQTDGTNAGTLTVKGSEPASPAPTGTELVDFNGAVLFSAAQAMGPVQLWRTTGTLPSTQPLGATNPQQLTRAATRVYFVNDGGELWVTDGTAPGTQLAVSVADQSPPSNLTAVGDDLYWTGSGDAGTELYRFVPDGGGRALVKDLTPSGSTAFLETAATTTLLIFSINIPGSGQELWRSDGTGPGTFRVAGFSGINGLTAIGSRVFFAGQGTELWVTDGTDAGTRALGGPAQVQGLARAGSTLFFAGSSDGGALELWKSDGTAPVAAGLPASNPRWIGGFDDGRVAFFANDGAGQKLWLSDGTAAGTVAVTGVTGTSPLSARPRLWAGSAAEVVFSGSDPLSGAELAAANVKTGAAQLIHDFQSGAPSGGPENFIRLGQVVIFSAYDGINRGVWAAGFGTLGSGGGSGGGGAGGGGGGETGGAGGGAMTDGGAGGGGARQGCGCSSGAELALLGAALWLLRGSVRRHPESRARPSPTHCHLGGTRRGPGERPAVSSSAHRACSGADGVARAVDAPPGEAVAAERARGSARQLRSAERLRAAIEHAGAFEAVQVRQAWLARRARVLAGAPGAAQGEKAAGSAAAGGLHARRADVAQLLARSAVGSADTLQRRDAHRADAARRAHRLLRHAEAGLAEVGGRAVAARRALRSGGRGDARACAVRAVAG